MRTKVVATAAIAVASLAALGGVTLAQQDRYAVKTPDELPFSEFRGYDKWETVAVSATEGSIKTILGNAATIQAYKDGAPQGGKAFPDGVKFAKIEWIKKRNAASPYFVEVPDTLKTVSFIVKDTKRFPNTHGWAYAQFAYDPGTKTFKSDVTGAECGYACHSKVAAQDYIFTAYPPR